MLEYGEFAYQTGLVDRHGYHAMKLFENLAKEYWPQIESKIVWSPRKIHDVTFWSILFWFAVLGHNFVCVYTKQPIQQPLQYFRTWIIGLGLVSWFCRTNPCKCADIAGDQKKQQPRTFNERKNWRRFAKQSMLVVPVSSRQNSSTSVWFTISCQRQCIGQRYYSMPAFVSCTIAEIWILSLPIHCRKMRIAKWNGRVSKNIERLVVSRSLWIQRWPGSYTNKSLLNDSEICSNYELMKIVPNFMMRANVRQLCQTCRQFLRCIDFECRTYGANRSTVSRYRAHRSFHQ